jgi:arginine decarboxylase
MPVELGDRDMIIPIVTIADTEDTVARFTSTLVAAIERHRRPPRRPEPSPAWSVSPEMAMPPREAFFSPNETVAADAAVGRISAELVAPYPPGIPVLAPGEVITADALAALRTAKAQGGRIAYAADPALTTFQVITEAPHGAGPA